MPSTNNQFQYNPWAPDWKHDCVAYCQKHNIAVTAWSSLAGTTMQSAKAFTVETIKAIADKNSISVAQVLLRWAVQKGLVVIPGTSNPKHMAENLAVYSFELSSSDMSAIDALSSDPIAKEFMFGPQDEK